MKVWLKPDELQTAMLNSIYYLKEDPKIEKPETIKHCYDVYKILKERFNENK